MLTDKEKADALRYDEGCRDAEARAAYLKAEHDGVPCPVSVAPTSKPTKKAPAKKKPAAKKKAK